MKAGTNSDPGTGPVRLEREFAYLPEDFRYLAGLAREKTGIVFGEHKSELVYLRISRRLRALKLTSFKAYVQLLKADRDGEETGHMVNALTTNVTQFFRSPGHFDHLQDRVFPDCSARIRDGHAQRIRLWSAGCSGGEEPYSMAIAALEHFGPRLGALDLKILATDIDTDRLGAAEDGFFSGDNLNDMPKTTRNRYFDRVGRKTEDRFRVKPGLRELLLIKRLNLLEEWPMKGEFDAIFCRNVMIYLSNEAKAELVRRFTGLLRPGGWFYLGTAESLPFSEPGLVREGGTIYRWQP